MSYQSRFKTPADAEKYSAAYDATLALWPVPHESLDIETSYGLTHINIAGSPASPPLILIPGAQVSSTVWYPNIEPLSRHFRVYALDVIDQTGRSVPARRLKTPQDCAEWLTEVLDCLNLERATLVGHSQGCCLAMSLAAAAPQRVERMVLLSPSAPFAQVRWQVLARMLPVFIRPTRGMFYRYFQWLTTMPIDANQPHPLIEQMIIGAMSYKPQELSFGIVTVFTDDVLRQITIPTLLVIGDHEVVVDPLRVLERARLMPNIKVQLIENSGHLLPVDQAEADNARIMGFFIQAKIEEHA